MRTKIIQAIGLFLVILFVYTATSKLLSFSTFTSTLSKSPLIGQFYMVAAIAIPLSELVISALIITPRYNRIGLFTSFLLMTLFTGYIAYMMMFVPELPCSCGGVLRMMPWNIHLVFNIIVTIASLIAIFLKKTNSTQVTTTAISNPDIKQSPTFY